MYWDRENWGWDRICYVLCGRGGCCDDHHLELQVRTAVPDIHSVIDQAVVLASSKSRQQGEPAEMGNQKAASANAEQVQTTMKYLDLDAQSLAGVTSSALLMIGTA